MKTVEQYAEHIERLIRGDGSYRGRAVIAQIEAALIVEQDDADFREAVRRILAADKVR